MRDRLGTLWPFAAMAGAVGLCCALPILLSLGVVGVIAGWSLQSWGLIGLGLVLSGAGWARWSRARRRHQACHGPPPTAPVDVWSPDADSASTTDATDATEKGSTR